MAGSADLFASLTPEQREMYGLTPASEGGKIFCGQTAEDYAINGTTYSLLPLRKITWGIAFQKLGPFSAAECRDIFAEALAEISACCDMSHEWTSDVGSANLQITSRRLDGSSGVLADCQIPVGNVTPDTHLLMRFDDSEIWTNAEHPANGQIDIYRVFLHEALHGHGLGHKPSNIADKALISPLYSTSIRNLQFGDKTELIRRYGWSKQQPAPTKPATPAAGKPVQVVVIQDGKQWSGELPRVK